MIANFYLTLKCLHIIGIISWMAGILYLYRLFIYHFEHGRTQDSIHSLLSLMETRLYKYITLPAMLVSILAGFGIILIHPELLSAKWFQIKLIAGVSMLAVTLYATILLHQFRNREFKNYTSRGLRILNEVPTLLMILIVIMVIIRPFS